VVWAKEKKIINISDGCKAYDFQGSGIKDVKITLTSSPVFVVCSEKSGK
jgi:hypothetical protein